MTLNWIGGFIVKSIAAGVAIGIGGTAYLATGYAWLFPIGLLIVCVYGLKLFTGRVCYWNYTFSLFWRLLLMWALNTLSAYILGLVVGWCKPGLVIAAMEMCERKLSEGLMLIPLAILCNVLIFVAVDGFRSNDTISVAKLIFATMAFVYCGFEHCIANAFYFGVAGLFGWKIIWFLICNMYWNSVGGLLAATVMKDGYSRR